MAAKDASSVGTGGRRTHKRSGEHGISDARAAAEAATAALAAWSSACS